MLALAGPASGRIATENGHQARFKCPDPGLLGSPSVAMREGPLRFRVVAALQVVPVLPKLTTDDDATTTTRKIYSASHSTARVGPPAQRVGGGHGGAVVLVAGRVALASCVAPRGAGTNLNGSDAAAWWFVFRYL